MLVIWMDSSLVKEFQGEFECVCSVSFESDVWKFFIFYNMETKMEIFNTNQEYKYRNYLNEGTDGEIRAKVDKIMYSIFY